MEYTDSGNYFLNSSGYYKVLVRFNLWHCMNNTDNPDNSSVLQTASKYILGTTLHEAWHYIFPSKSFTSYHHEPSPECKLKVDFQSKFAILYSWIVLAAVLIMVSLTCSASICIMLRLLRQKSKLARKVNQKETQENETKIDDKHCATDNLCHDQDQRKNAAPEKKEVIKTACTNYQINPDLKQYSLSKRDVGWFLKNSVDYLYSEMDKFLIHKASGNTVGVGAPSSGSLTEQVMSPRLPSRRIRPRSRTRQTSSPSLSSTDTEDEAMERRAWQEFQTQIVSMGHCPYYEDVDNEMLQVGSAPIQNLTCYYRDHCSIRFEQWKAANLIVNYSLCLLNKALKSLIGESGAAFHGFKMTGSVIKGIKATSVNQFDVHMIFRGTSFDVDEIWFQQSSISVPPGRMILHTREKNDKLSSSLSEETAHLSSSTQNKLIKLCNLNSQEFRCLSSDELVKFAEELVDRAIQKLYTETRSLIDRLPFRIQRYATANLILSLDTRHVIGLNISEIKVQLIPAFCLPLLSWYSLIDIYAVPPWHSRDIKRKSTGSTRGFTSHMQTVPIDKQWSLSLGELEAKFLDCVDRRMSYAGVHSCHRACVSVLKTLFTSISRKSLLDKGELSSIIIETVVYFLLLESSPQQWSFDRFADRFSDSVHFLKTALQHGRLPNFFLNNPHLMRLMPALVAYPILVKGRQENLLSDLSPEMIDKTLKYVDFRIKDAGLQGCVNDEYSEDMWEYEFFVFN